MHGYTDLLLSPRELEGKYTARGSLMGEPGTKVILTLVAKCLDVSTRHDAAGHFMALRLNTFQSAGDD
jgi:hypothetical protein